MKQVSEVAAAFAKADRDELIRDILAAISCGNSSEGSLWARYYKNQGLTFYVGTKADNHLCAEAVSQDTLFTLFGEDYDFQDEDACTIVDWMLAQK